MSATGESDLRNYYDYVDSQREAKLRPALERLLPVMAMSTWGAVPEGMQIDFPPLWTPTAKELADIAKVKAEAVVSVFQAGLIRADSAQKELKKLEEETGLFGSISDEEVAANAGKTYQDVTELRDPLAGLGMENELHFDGTVQDAAVMDYSPSQPRDKNGKWTGGSANGKINKTKYAPSKQRNKADIQLPAKTYAKLTGVLNSLYPELPKGEIRTIRSANRQYTVESDGYGGFKTLRVFKIK